MRAFVLAVLLTGCSQPLPEGISRFGLDAETFGISVDLQARKATYFTGGYPRKTYRCVRGLDGGAESCERVQAGAGVETAGVDAVMAGTSLYAVTLSTRPRTDERRWMAPQDLHRADTMFASKAWSTPWTQRPGRLLGYDEKTGSLLYAVTDRDAPDLWIIKADDKTLAAAGSVIDRPASAAGTWKQMAMSLGALMAATVVIAAVYGGMR